MRTGRTEFAFGVESSIPSVESSSEKSRQIYVLEEAEPFCSLRYDGLRMCLTVLLDQVRLILRKAVDIDGSPRLILPAIIELTHGRFWAFFGGVFKFHES